MAAQFLQRQLTPAITSISKGVQRGLQLGLQARQSAIQAALADRRLKIESATQKRLQQESELRQEKFKEAMERDKVVDAQRAELHPDKVRRGKGFPV